MVDGLDQSCLLPDASPYNCFAFATWCRCCVEVVIDGLAEADVSRAMSVGIRAACDAGSRYGLRMVTAGTTVENWDSIIFI